MTTAVIDRWASGRMFVLATTAGTVIVRRFSRSRELSRGGRNGYATDREVYLRECGVFACGHWGMLQRIVR